MQATNSPKTTIIIGGDDDECYTENMYKKNTITIHNKITTTWKTISPRHRFGHIRDKQIHRNTIL